MSTAARFPILAAALTVLAVTPDQTLHAQQISAQSIASTADPTRADQLHARAVSMFAEPDRHHSAADLLQRAASLRDASDAAAVNELMTAGKLYAYTGDNRKARGALEEAARRALALGSIVDAANALVDAAFVAVRQGDGGAARTLVGRAELLARSPQLTSAQRVAILGRINPRLAVGGSQ